MCSTLTTPAKGEDPNHFTAEEVIGGGGWATCRLCEDVFRRKTETLRFCKHCGNGFCEGNHGNFAYQHGTCIVCGSGGKHRFGPRIYGSLNGNRVVW
jgi:hypothetical protein